MKEQAVDELTVTLLDLSAVFTEWERRYRENPDRFWAEGRKLLKETPASYGDAAAPYFVEIARELGRHQ